MPQHLHIMEPIRVLSLALFVGVIQAKGSNNSLDFRIIDQNSTTATLTCSYNGTTKQNDQLYFTVHRNGVKEVVQSHNGSNKIVFKMSTPQCGKNETITCQVQNGIYHGKDRTFLAKPDKPVVTVNHGKPVPVNKKVEVECRINNLCTRERVHFELHDHYHMNKPNVTYRPTNDGNRFSATAIASVMFNNPGEHDVICKSEESGAVSIEKVVVTTNAKDPEHNLPITADKPEITINDKQPVRTHEAVTLKCQVNNMSAKQGVEFDHPHGYHFTKPNITYSKVGARHSATVITLAIFTKTGEYKITCKATGSGDSTSQTVTVQHIDDPKTEGYKSVSSATAMYHIWKFTVGFAVISIFIMIS